MFVIFYYVTCKLSMLTIFRGEERKKKRENIRMDLQLEVVHAKSNKPLVTLYDILDTFTVEELKKNIASKKSKYRDLNRQELRLEPKGKPLKDELTLKEVGLNNGAMVYFKVWKR